MVAFGDSLVAGRGAPAGRDFVSLLSERLGVPIINAGHSGDTTRAAMTRLDSDVLSRDPRIVIGTKKTVLIQLEAQLNRAITQHDVVRFRSGEILHRGAAALGRNEPEVCLVSAAEEHARFGGAVTEDAFDRRIANEHVHQGRIAANRKNVDVTTGFTPAAQASDRNELHRRRLETEVGDEVG